MRPSPEPPSRSPRTGAGSWRALDEHVSRLAVLAAHRVRPGSGFVGAVCEQAREARLVELRPRVVRHAAVDRDVRRRLARALHDADAVERHARLADERAARLEHEPRHRQSVQRPRPLDAVDDRSGEVRGSWAPRRSRRSGCRARRPRRRPAASSRAPSGTRPRSRRASRPRTAPARRRGAASRGARAGPGRRARARRARAIAPSACSGGRPNFEPRWPVLIASCVSGSIPGVTRTSTRRTPAAAARSTSSSASSTTSQTSASAAAPELVVRLVVAVDDDPLRRDARAKRQLELAQRRHVRAEPLLGEQARAARRSGTPSSRRA